MTQPVSEIFDTTSWQVVPGFEGLQDVTYHRHVRLGVVRVAFNRPEVRNAFRPQTVDELYAALDHARLDTRVGVVLLTGNGPSPKDAGWAFSSGGDQRVRGADGYLYGSGEQGDSANSANSAEPANSANSANSPTPPGSAGRLHILEVQRLIRFMPKVVIALVGGWAAGGGHSLVVVADLALASAEHARFKQTDADVASFDAGYGSAYLARQVGQKFAREIFFLGREYDAQRAYELGVVNAVVPHDQLEATGIEWAAEILGKSPQAIRMRLTTVWWASRYLPARPPASPPAPPRPPRGAMPSCKSAAQTGPASTGRFE